MNVKVFKTHPNAIVPSWGTDLSAGFDLATLERVDVGADVVMARTGLVIQAPADHMLMIVPRSSTYKKWGISLGNTIGIVDEDYCGPEDELKLALRRSDHRLKWPIEVPAGTRLAQGIFVPITRTEFEVVEEPIAANRGGFGSTG